MNEFGQHVIAALHWSRTTGWAGTRAQIDQALSVGVGGFLLRGGPRYEASQLARALHAHSPHPVLVAADAERGAGERFPGAVSLPPALALASLGDDEAIRRAARITARDLREMGINWVLGPVCDLDVEQTNPIVATRAFGSDVSQVAARCAEWIDACQSESVLACAKHFPGHGRTSADSHLSLPVQEETLTELRASDLVPFQAAVDAGVASVMTSHVAYPAIDAARVPATHSAPVVQLLREELGFRGLVVSDGLEMAGALVGIDEGESAVRALAAGCDLLLAPSDPVAVAQAVQQAVAAGRLDAESLETSRQRRDMWATWGRWLPDGRGPTLDDRTWSKQVADRVLRVDRGRIPWVPPVTEVVIVDDDPAAQATPRAFFVQALESLGRTVRLVPGATPEGEGVLIVAVFADVMPGKGHVALTQHSRLTVRLAAQGARTLKRDTLVVLFGHPRVAADVPDAQHVLVAWSGERGMQEAAARALCS